MSKRVAILTSGGDAPGMNACIRATIIACQKANFTLLGYNHGYNGLLQQEYIPLSLDSTHNLIQQGGTILHSARCKEFKNHEGIIKAANNLREAEIDTLIVIGGDGSFRGAAKLSEEWEGQILGIPGTIDNDISGTDATIGYFTAIDTAMSSIDKVRDTADAFERVFLVEVMGRNAGFLALNAALSSAADYVVVPEFFKSADVEIKKIVTQIKAQRALKGTVSYIVVVAENVWPNGLPGLAEALQEHDISDVRPVTLGHVQRGGSPVAQDRLLATMLGEFAISLVGGDVTNIMVGEVNQRPVIVPLPKTWEETKPLNEARVDAMCTLMNERYSGDKM
ncbi:ATP-dependent 6-phosphofructokinase [Alteromonas sp. ALT199]|uniref:ATP-dependent 6-phosphofructokinase n=1 Tax=unclassified Alteromonas TaxID=2614992 RepID=UPI00044CE236|nr:ATP-dependent 6-phosphofructokinase [Alteromonas sp. ALT199]MBT3137330.1 ATP-dependent 6-phosphofructokinase [Alteromonas sp. ALT199]